MMAWVENSSPSSNARLGLLIGAPGTGKSRLLNAIQARAFDSHKHNWCVHLIRANENETASALLERLLHGIYQAIRTDYVVHGPDDKTNLKALVEAVPAIGKLMSTLVEEDRRPGWQRFLAYTQSISAHLEQKNGRLIILVDAAPRLNSDQGAEWRTISPELAQNVRIIVAQRPDDSLAADPELRVSCRIFPGSGTLGDLDRAAVLQWYAWEMSVGRLAEQARIWPQDIPDTLADAAFDRYAGLPLAHESVILLLTAVDDADPISSLLTWPRQLEALLNAVYERLAAQSEDRLRLMLVLAMFGTAVTKSIWARCAGLDPLRLETSLADPRFRWHAHEKDLRWQPYHPLFTERLTQALRSLGNSLDLARNAWKAIEPTIVAAQSNQSACEEESLLVAASLVARWLPYEDQLEALDTLVVLLSQQSYFDAAESLCLAILSRAREPIVSVVCRERLSALYETRGSYDRAELELLLALESCDRYGYSSLASGIYANLGLVYFSMGDLARGEKAIRDSIEKAQPAGPPEELASARITLGRIHLSRGALDQAELEFTQARQLFARAKNTAGMAVVNGNLGLVCLKRGNYPLAERYYLEALRNNTALKRNVGIVANKGDLAGVYAESGKLDATEREVRGALSLADRAGLEVMKGFLLGQLARIYFERDDFARAEELCREAMSIEERFGRREGMATRLGELAVTLAAQGKLAQSEEVLLRSIVINRELGRVAGMAQDNCNLGGIYFKRGDLRRARELWTTARNQFLEASMPHWVARLDGQIAELSPEE